MVAGLQYYRVGDFERAIEIWESYLQAAPEAWSSTRLLSLAYAAAGRYEEALRTDRRLSAEAAGLPRAVRYTWFDPIREDPRFAALLKEVGLE